MATPRPTANTPSSRDRGDHEVTAPHYVLCWPSTMRILEDLRPESKNDLLMLSERGMPWLLERTLVKPVQVHHDWEVTSQAIIEPVEGNNEGQQQVKRDWDIASIRGSSRAYFNSFNMLRPIPDSDDFLQEIEKRFLKGGFIDGEIEGVLLLLVSALGQVAIAG